ncbi:MAG: hypothetical protein IJB15_08240, partial [Clostridia bacterium]|nr:hypothetical protein [Clostridia bacterium]
MKRQLLCIWVTVAVMISLFAVYATADETVTQPTIVFQPGEVTTTGGIKTVEIQVKIRNNPGFVTATIPVKWEPAHLELIEVQNEEAYFVCEPEKVYSDGKLADGWHGMPLVDSHNEAGLYHLAWGYDASFQESRFNFMEDGVLATLTFKVIADDTVVSTDVQTVERDIANFMNWDMEDNW